MTPAPGSRQPPRPRRACAPPRATPTRAQGPRPTELPKRPGGSSPGTLPLWGASFSPPPGPTPAAPRTPATRGTNLSHLLRSRGAGAPSAPWSCRPATPAARTVREASGDPVRSALRLPSLLLLSSASSPARGTETGRGSACVVPHPVLRPVLGGSRVLADFPPLWSWVAEGGMGERGTCVGGKRRDLSIGAGLPRGVCVCGGVSFMYSCFRF